MRAIWNLTWALPTALSLATIAGTAAAATPSNLDVIAAGKEFRTEHPHVRMMGTMGQSQRIAAPNMAFGGSPFDTANTWVDQWSNMLGIDADAVELHSPFPSGETQLGLMYNQNTGTYKLTAVYFAQAALGLPVHGSRLAVLTRNEPGFPAVYVAADLRDMRNFNPPTQLPAVNADLAVKAATQLLGKEATTTQPELLIYAGNGEAGVTPVVAMVFDAQVSNNADPDNYKKERLIIDAFNGVLLDRENRILNFTDGVVEGMASYGSGADECEDEIPIGLPYARVTQGGSTYYADAYGNFSTGGSGTLTSYIDGTWFNVQNNSGSDAQLSGNGDFLHNSANTDAQLRAQVNSYIESNVVRDYALYYHPTFPVIGDQTAFPVNTGVSGSCNAFYDYASINFYNAGGGCNNTAFSVIVHHEYGHHLVASAGSGQDAYGEGMGDVLGVLITGDNQLARGFYQGDCTNGIRNADNSHQYPCSGEIHDCGQLISGCVWDALLLLPESVVASLAINSMPLHNGGGIDPTITFDWLVLDDDNGDLDDGTPHSVEILQAFAEHNMDELPEPLDNDDCTTAREITWGAWDVNTVGALASGVPVDESQCSDTYMTECEPDVWYHLTACGSGTMTVSLCDTVSFDSDLAVYRGTCDDMQQIACNGDGGGCGGYTSYLTVSVTQGESLFVRVGGWNGATGSGIMNVDGPGEPCDSDMPAEIVFPDGRPDEIDPTGGTSVPVEILDGESTPIPDTARLNWENSDGSGSNELKYHGSVFYSAIFPPMTCPDSVEWWVTVSTEDGSDVMSGTDTAAVRAGLDIDFQDDFQTDMGWTVDAGASTGNWERVVPSTGGVRCDAPTDADGSGMCYVTGDGAEEDVDEGTTILTSPTLTAAAGGVLSYNRWFSNGAACSTYETDDAFVVEFRTGNTGWSNLETVGPGGSEVNGGWYLVEYDLDSLPGFTPGDFQLRFICTDQGTGSVVEAAVDGIMIATVDCGDDMPCDGDLDGNGTVDVNDLLTAIDGFGGDYDVNDILSILANFGNNC